MAYAGAVVMTLMMTGGIAAQERRPDPTALSFRYLHAGELRANEQTSVVTPQGRMTCNGGNIVAYKGGIASQKGTLRRSCAWD